jgi:uncharacterized membrane protein YbhN (UPF0104 family)
VKTALIALAKLAVSVILLTLVARAFDTRGLVDRFAHLSAADALIALAIAMVIMPLQALRWKVVLDESGRDGAGHPFPYARALGVLWIGQFFSQVLPSSVGGDAMRMWYAHKSGMRPGDAIVTVVVDRLISLLGVLIVAACGLPWLLRVLPDGAARSAIVMIIAAGVAGFAAVVTLAGNPRWLPRWRVARALLAPAVLLRRVLLSPARLLPALAFSITGTVGFCALVYQLARALGVALDFQYCLLLFPPVMFASAIPVSIGGWGMREGAMVIAFGYAQVPAADAFAISVLFGLVLLAMSLPGIVYWLARGDAAGSLAQAERLAKSQSG